MSDIKKVLIVDDDASLTNWLSEHLSATTKYKLYIALTGEEALKVLEDKNPDVVLLDMQLPGINGIQVLKIIREKYSKTKVFVITSYDDQVKDPVAKLGVDGFFPKPAQLVEITQRIKEVLEAKERDDTTVTPIPLSEVKKKDDVMPVAKIMFIEREFAIPYLLPIQSRDPQYPPPVLEPYGEYEYEAVYCQRDVNEMLKQFKPDIIICATDIPPKEPHGWGSVSTAPLIKEIMKSKYAPKAIIVHGTQQSINSKGLKEDKSTSMWVENEDIYNYDVEKNKENAERLNKMIWSICFKHGLVKKVK